MINMVAVLFGTVTLVNYQDFFAFYKKGSFPFPF